MANARSPGGGSGPSAKLTLDLTSFQNAPAIAREAGRATAREISNAFKVVQNEQRLAQTQAQQTLAVLRAQQSQITATTRAESQVRIQQARAESVAQQQEARAASASTIQEEKRKTAAFNAEIRSRAQAARASQGQNFGQGAATFAGAAFGGPIGGLAGALAGGSPALAAGLIVGQGARAAIEASQVAVAYDRQRLAATNLAGSQGKLNELLDAYQRASGGAVDKATALANVTRLQAVGFADNASEVDKFTRAVRGSSIAMGKLQEEIGQEVQLAISNQSLRRLDQIGLGISEVNTRIAELRGSNQGLTREAAFQEAVLGLLNEKYGALADSAEGQATGVEKAGRAWRDLRLELAQDINTNAVDDAGNAFSQLLERIQQARTALRQWSQEIEIRRASSANTSVLGLLLGGGLSSTQANFIGSTSARDASRHAAAGSARPPGPRFTDEQTAALRRRDEGFAEIERESALARLEATRSYEQQRASVITNYEKNIAREAEDFARQRANAERKLNFSILDIHQDSARQRVRWEEELARNIAQAQGDSAERVADLREDSNKRLAKSEEQYAKDREKRQRDHQKTLREAAANLDAVAVREEQKSYREEKEEAKDAHEEQKQEIQAQLQERLDDEAKSLAKSIKQQQDANQRRIEEQAENDRLRIEEMKAAFEDQKEQEDIERGIMMDRRADDHAAQLIEMETQQATRIQQIKDHAQEERDQFTEESNKFLEEVGIHNQAWLDKEQALNDGIIKLHTELLEAERRALLTPGHPSLADPYVDRVLPNGAITPSAPATNNRSSSSRTSTVNIQPGAITIVPPPNANYSLDERFAAYIHGVLADFFEDYPQ